MSVHDPDSVLVERALSGGDEGFAAIVDRYKGAVLAVALARVRGFDDAEDVTQQVFIEASGRLANLRDPSRLGAWLRSIAIHRSINHLARRRRVAELEEAHPPGVVRAPAPDETLERDELRQRVMAAVGRLSKTQRETVVLYYLSGHTQKEVARILEVPVGTVKYRLFEARKRLKEDMADLVEAALRDSQPDDELAARVLKLLDAHRGGGQMFHGGIWTELNEIGQAGVAGFRQAMEVPNFRSRRAAVHYSGLVPLEEAIELLRKAASDSNRKVRSAAVAHLMGALDIDDDRRRRELLPVALPLLFDRSWKVRFRAAGFLSRPEWAPAVPLETAARALAVERHPGNIRRMQHLVQTILETVTGARTR